MNAASDIERLTVPFSPATAAAIAEHMRVQDPERAAGFSSQPQEKDGNIIEDIINVNSEFLRIVPENEAAQLAFHELACKKLSGDLDLSHAKFIIIEGKGRLADEAGHDHGLSDEETSVESCEEQAVTQEYIYRGYFTVSFRYGIVTREVKWVLGKGTRKSGPDRNVDILLAVSGSKYRKHLAPAHAFLRMNLQSGAWMLMTGQDCKHVTQQSLALSLLTHTESFNFCSHSPVWIDGHVMRHFEMETLIRPRTSFVTEGLRYLAQFTVDDLSSEELYIRERNLWLRELDIPVPATRISDIPFESDVHTTLAVFRQGLGSGTFGTVFEEFERKTGNLRAIKKIVLKSAADKPYVDSELLVHEEFKETTGVVRFYGCRNSLGGFNTSIKEVDIWPLEVYIVLEKGSSFLECFRKSHIRIDNADKRNLCKQLLTELTAIH